MAFSALRRVNCDTCARRKMKCSGRIDGGKCILCADDQLECNFGLKRPGPKVGAHNSSSSSSSSSGAAPPASTVPAAGVAGAPSALNASMPAIPAAAGYAMAPAAGAVGAVGSVGSKGAVSPAAAARVSPLALPVLLLLPKVRGGGGDTAGGTGSGSGGVSARYGSGSGSRSGGSAASRAFSLKRNISMDDLFAFFLSEEEEEEDDDEAGGGSPATSFDLGSGDGASFLSLPRTSSGGGVRLSVGTLGAGNGGFFVSTLSPADPSQDEKDMETVREVLRLDSEADADHAPQPPRKKRKLDQLGRYQASPQPPPKHDKKMPCRKQKAAAGSRARGNHVPSTSARRSPNPGLPKPAVTTAAASTTSAASAAVTQPIGGGAGGGDGSPAIPQQQQQQQRLSSRFDPKDSGSRRRCLDLPSPSAANGGGGGGEYPRILAGLGEERGVGGGGGRWEGSVPGALALDGGDPPGFPFMQGFQGRGGGSGGVKQVAEPPHPQMNTRSDSFRLEDWVLPQPNVAKGGEGFDIFDGELPEVLSSPLLSPAGGGGGLGSLFTDNGSGSGGSTHGL